MLVSFSSPFCVFHQSVNQPNTMSESVAKQPFHTMWLNHVLRDSCIVLSLCELVYRGQFLVLLSRLFLRKKLEFFSNLELCHSLSLLSLLL